MGSLNRRRLLKAGGAAGAIGLLGHAASAQASAPTPANPLLEEVVHAYGGLERWSAVTALTLRGRLGPCILRARFPGNKLAVMDARIRLAEQHVVLRGFPHEDQQGVFDRGDVRIETRDGVVISERRDARAAFFGSGALRRQVYWDALDTTYFAGYALWNYLSTPLLLTREGFTVIEGEPWSEGGERWRRLEVTFPDALHTHSPRQTFYVDGAGLIRRHDYWPEVVFPEILHVGRMRAAHYHYDHLSFGGLVSAARRRVLASSGPSLPVPLFVALHFDDIQSET